MTSNHDLVHYFVLMFWNLKFGGFDFVEIWWVWGNIRYIYVVPRIRNPPSRLLFHQPSNSSCFQTTESQFIHSIITKSCQLSHSSTFLALYSVMAISVLTFAELIIWIRPFFGLFVNFCLTTAVILTFDLMDFVNKPPTWAPEWWKWNTLTLLAETHEFNSDNATAIHGQESTQQTRLCSLDGITLSPLSITVIRICKLMDVVEGR